MRRKRIVIVIILGILTVLIIAIAIFRSHNNSTRSYTKQDIISLGPQRKPHVISEIKWSITDQRLYKKKYLNDADAKEMLYSHYYGIVQNKLVSAHPEMGFF